MRSKYEVAESMALSATSFAMDKNMTFPFVTIPDFEVQASNSRELSDTDLLSFCPLVTRAQQTEWEGMRTPEGGKRWLPEKWGE